MSVELGWVQVQLHQDGSTLVLGKRLSLQAEVEPRPAGSVAAAVEWIWKAEVQLSVRYSMFAVVSAAAAAAAAVVVVAVAAVVVAEVVGRVVVVGLAVAESWGCLNLEEVSVLALTLFEWAGTAAPI